MSALIYYITEGQVAVAMDTLAMASEEGSPVPGFYATKAFLFPHLRGFMCGTGLLNLAVLQESFYSYNLISSSAITLRESSS